MTFEGDLRAFLAGSTRVQAHVGSSDAARIEPSVLPEDTRYPAVRYERISTDRQYTQDGPTGKPNALFQIDSFAKDVDAAFDLSESIRKAMDGFKGPMGAEKVDGTFSDDQDAHYNEDSETYRVRQDWRIYHTEATT